jgi:glycosyltransferase involved in cell wall biosynthesis
MKGPDAIIPHGVSTRFRAAPRAQHPLSAYSAERPFKLLYVSAIAFHKHQWRVVDAVASLVRSGLPVSLALIGPAQDAGAVEHLREAIARNSAESFVRYVGAMAHQELPAAFAAADGFVFASTCENLPIGLLEAMNAGLPIACSDRSPMPAILGDGGIYFNPDEPDELRAALQRFVTSPEERAACASAASENARPYTWERCAHETFSFLARIA